MVSKKSTGFLTWTSNSPQTLATFLTRTHLDFGNRFSPKDRLDFVRQVPNLRLSIFGTFFQKLLILITQWKPDGP